MRPWPLPLLLLLGARPLPDPVPTTRGMWYWHTPFSLSKDDLARLGRMKVQTLYVRAGTFSSDGKRAVVIQPQHWNTEAPGLEIVVTMNFDPGLVSHLESIPVDRLATDVATGLLQARRKAKGRFAGYQLDVDCPTRLLPRYADLLRRVRRKVGGPFSITALPTWLASSDLKELADAVDCLVPQFYENRTPLTLDELAPVSDPEALRRGLRRLKALGIPCRVGLAAYGHALLYDPQGRLAGMYRGLGPGDAMRHPSLRMESGGPLAEERRLVFRAIAPDSRGRGRGAWIAYVLPTAAALRRQWEVYRAFAPPNALGPVIYRFPEEGEAMALPLSAVEAALSDKVAKPDLRVTLKTHAAPWDSIAGREDPVQIVRATARAVGNGPSEFGRQAVQLRVVFDRPNIDAVAPGDFDGVVLGTVGREGRFVAAPRTQANAALFYRGGVLPGEALRTGDLETRGARTMRAEWFVQGPEGGAEGRLAERPLQNDRSLR